MGASLVALAEDVEHEQVDIVVERLVVQEQLGKPAEVLAVLLLLPAIHLKWRTGAAAVRPPCTANAVRAKQGRRAVVEQPPPHTHSWQHPTHTDTTPSAKPWIGLPAVPLETARRKAGPGARPHLTSNMERFSCR